MQRLLQLVVWFDQGVNVLLGSGWSDETLSSYFHRKADWRERFVDRLFFWQDRHCREAFRTEILRRHLPPGMRGTS